MISSDWHRAYGSLVWNHGKNDFLREVSMRAGKTRN